jgi:hypothetical protein
MAEDQQSGFVDTCTVFIDRCVTLAAFTILKIVRSPLSEHIDLEAAERAYFLAIRFARRVTLQSDDLGARGATLMSQLWTSKNIFRYGSGRVESLRGRIRSRLAMSVVFDCFWWWREEFGGRPSPYRDDTNDAAAGGKMARFHLFNALADGIFHGRNHNRYTPSC